MGRAQELTLSKGNRPEMITVPVFANLPQFIPPPVARPPLPVVNASHGRPTGLL